MGTSKCYSGPSKGLVPSWVDDPAPGALPNIPAGTPTVPGDPGDQNPDQPAQTTSGASTRMPYELGM